MHRIKKFSKNWIENFENRYNNYLDLLIEAFALYYGYNYKEYLESLIKPLKFDYILNENSLYYIENYSNDSILDMFHRYFKLLERCRKYYSKKGFSVNEINYQYINHCILKKCRKHSIEYNYLESFLEEPTVAITHFEKNGLVDKILLSIYFLNDNCIIHEINHVVSTPLNNFNIFPNDTVDELLNELIALDILEIFKRLGGNISGNNIEINFMYNKKFFLINDFYIEFKELIKECFINRDIKILEDNLGSKNLNTYFKLIDKLYKKDDISEKEIKMLKLLILMMKEYYNRRYERVRFRR